jgi:hypothetical protein
MGTSPQAALGVSLLIVAFAYLPFRDVLWRRTIGRKTMKDHEMFAAVAQVALIHDAEARAGAWKALLSKVYEPLEIGPGRRDAPRPRSSTRAWPWACPPPPGPRP